MVAIRDRCEQLRTILHMSLSAKYENSKNISSISSYLKTDRVIKENSDLSDFDKE